MKIIKKKYEFCYSGIGGRNRFDTNPYALLRVHVSLEDPLSYVRFLIENGLAWKYRRDARTIHELASADSFLLP